MEKIIAWLLAHPLISIHALEKQCKIPRGALSRAVNGNDYFLSTKHLPALVEALKEYGYKNRK
jgi:hypothetical protein